MKTKSKLTWLAVTAGGICVAFNAYALYRFGWGWGDGTTQMNEAGGFLGGVVGPFLNFITLIAVLFTTAMQAEELRVSNETLQATKEELAQSREIAQKQFYHLEVEARKSELLKVLELLDSEALSLINTDLDKGDTIKSNASGVAVYWTHRDTKIPSQKVTRILETVEHFIFIIRRFNIHLADYEAVCDKSAVVSYYEYKYCNIVCEFAVVGAISSSDAGIFLRGAGHEAEE